MDGSSGTALLLWDNRYRTDKNSSVKLSKIIVLKTDLINRMVVEINTLIIKAEKLNTVVIEIDKTTKITVIEIIKIIRLEKYPEECEHSPGNIFYLSKLLVAYAQITR